MPTLPVPRPHRRSYVKHRQDVVRQILLPMALVILLVVAAAVLVFIAVQNGGDVAKWAQFATIWMVIPLMGLMLVILLLASGTVYLLIRLLQISPRYTGIAQEYALRLNAQIVLWTERIMEPIIKLQSWLSMFSKEE